MNRIGATIATLTLLGVLIVAGIAMSNRKPTALPATASTAPVDASLAVPNSAQAVVPSARLEATADAIEERARVAAGLEDEPPVSDADAEAALGPTAVQIREAEANAAHDAYEARRVNGE